MLKEIKYNGFTATPSDYECPDGDLATLVNLIPEDGEIKPVPTPEKLFSLPRLYSVSIINKGAGYTHYIIRYGNSLYWIDKPEKGSVFSSSDFTSKNLLYNFGTRNINDISVIGNTLVVLASDGMHYILWKGDVTGYLYLGSHFPELPISFGLQGEVKRYGWYGIDFYHFSPYTAKFSEANRKKVTEQALAKVNKFIADYSTNDGKFIFPFFVRYAYRLYDQSLVMHSAPVLMVCSSDYAPRCFGRIRGFVIDDINTFDMYVTAMVCQLDYAIRSQADKNTLLNWQDIVKSVDVFISKPIYSYDQNGECTGFIKTGMRNTTSICKHTNQAVSNTTYPQRYMKQHFNWAYVKTFYPETLTMGEYEQWELELPMRDEESIKGDIRDCAQFYLLKSIRVEDLQTSRTIIPVGKDYLQSLVNREVMTDDYDSHDTIIPQHAFVYNSRLNVANLNKNIFGGFHAAAMFPYTDGYVQLYTEPPTSDDYLVSCAVYFCIRQNEKEIVVRGGYAAFGNQTPFLYLFYPNTNAYKAILVSENPFTTYYEVILEPHPTLNGAFYFGGWEGINVLNNQVSGAPQLTTDNTVYLPNKNYTSEVNNPFYFPALGVNTVGTGTILGICAAVRALSQGQFGQFPLYAFTDEGVWALEVSAEGKYTARQPVTRDVCINADSITQLDNAVLFITDRGIMLISGSESQCISDNINAETFFSLSSLSGLSSVCGDAIAASVPTEDLRTFLTSARMLYDYANQRIIVYNPTETNDSMLYPYAYVYSLKSKMWGMIQSSVKETLNAYPDALALQQTQLYGEENAIVNFSESDLSPLTAVNGIIVTRPLKLDAPDLLKTIDTIIQRGYFRKGHVQSILYGSRDLFNWHLVYSSTDHYLRGFRGTPYKYFRIALLCSLTKEESIFGCTVQYTPRLLDQPR